MKKLLLLLVAAAATFSPVIARADLIGTSVYGTFYLNGGAINFFDPTFGLVLPVYGNASGLPVVVGSNIEFGVTDGNIAYTFDFSGTALEVTNTSADVTTEAPWVVTFTDSGFSLDSLSVINDPVAGLAATLSGNVLTLTYTGDTANAIGDRGTADFSLAAAGTPTGVVPEPSTLALLGTGLLGAAGWIRRRLS